MLARANSHCCAHGPRGVCGAASFWPLGRCLVPLDRLFGEHVHDRRPSSRFLERNWRSWWPGNLLLAKQRWVRSERHHRHWDRWSEGAGGTVLLNNLLQIRGVAIRAVCDADPKLPRKGVEHGCREGAETRRKGTAEWKQLLKMDGIDAVVAAIPCDPHAALYLDVIAAGKDSVTARSRWRLDPEDLNAVVKATQASKQIRVQIGHQRRADPRFPRHDRPAIARGEIGVARRGRGVLWSNSWGPLLELVAARASAPATGSIEQAVPNWDVMNWAIRARPRCVCSGPGPERPVPRPPSRARRARLLLRSRRVPRRNLREHHPQLGCTQKFNEEYTRLIGTKGGSTSTPGPSPTAPTRRRMTGRSAAANSTTPCSPCRRSSGRFAPVLSRSARSNMGRRRADLSPGRAALGPRGRPLPRWNS